MFIRYVRSLTDHELSSTGLPVRRTEIHEPEACSILGEVPRYVATTGWDTTSSFSLGISSSPAKSSKGVHFRGTAEETSKSDELGLTDH